MDKSTSIILVKEQSNYRKVAQNNWGLTDEQMSGMHVHHFPPISEGGKNIAEHLYVCSPSIHCYGWHQKAYFIEHAANGGRRNLGQKSENRSIAQKIAQKGKNKNKKYWHNVLTGEERFCVGCPGENWMPGMSETHKDNCYKPITKKAVICIFPDGSEVEYKSAYDAAKATGKDRSDIGKCCRGQKNKTGNLRWKFKG